MDCHVSGPPLYGGSTPSQQQQQSTTSWTSPVPATSAQPATTPSSSPQQRVPEQKVILLGDFGVGKTSLFRRFTNNTFTTATDRKSTLGLDFYTRTFTDEQGDHVKLQLWDTGGMERVASITSSYYKFAEGAVLVFDLSNTDSFHSLAQHLLEVASYAENCKVFLCGNKLDLVDDDVELAGHANAPGSIVTTTSTGVPSTHEDGTASVVRSSSASQREFHHVTLRDMEQFCEQTNVITSMYVTSCKSSQGVSAMFTDISRQIKSASRARYELAKHAVLDSPFQLTDHGEENGDDGSAGNQQNCAC